MLRTRGFLPRPESARLLLLLAFFAFVFSWIKLAPGSPGQSWLWLGSYFGFSAVCMLALALRVRSLDRSQPGEWQALSSLGKPKHAH